ncbi:MAG: alpha/beta hydrolase, partial [Henriciella sp.]|uniref:alpha/beta fold hydrolase n=1 Tax=Henriciella sp. TaxID=1968823 RepID=UPI003C766816
TLNDMAADAAALIEALGAEKADVMGFSMGGMIVQLMALNHPERVRTLIPVMTTSGDPSLPQSSEEAQKALTAVPEFRSADAIGDLAAQSRRVIGSHETVRNADEDVKAMAIRCFERSDRPMGVARQYAAILAQPRWHERLSDLDVPTLVLHGAQDPLIRPAAGEDIAKRIPGAEIEIIDKWGHDMPEKMVPVLLNRIVPFLGKHVPEEARADAGA